MVDQEFRALFGWLVCSDVGMNGSVLRDIGLRYGCSVLYDECVAWDR